MLHCEEITCVIFKLFHCYSKLTCCFFCLWFHCQRGRATKRGDEQGSSKDGSKRREGNIRMRESAEIKRNEAKSGR